MGICAEPRLVVKRTFLEYVEYSPGQRTRSLTDSALSYSSDELGASSCGSSPRPLEEAPAKADGVVNESATEELKAFLGLGVPEAEKENLAMVNLIGYQSPKLTPMLSPLHEEQLDAIASYWAPPSSMPLSPSPEQCNVVWIPVDFNGQSDMYQVPCMPTSSPPPANVQQMQSWPVSSPSLPRPKPAKAADAFANSAEMPESMRTTVIMRNIPNNYTRDMLLELLDSEGFACNYSFVYLPIDFNTQAGLGYAFIDLVSPEWAQAFWSHFEGFRGWLLPSEKVCCLNWSCPLQGLEAHIERYRNSPVMHPSMLDEWKPVLFCNGERLVFPPPTKLIKAPKIRSRPGAPQAQF